MVCAQAMLRQQILILAAAGGWLYFVLCWGELLLLVCSVLQFCAIFVQSFFSWHVEDVDLLSINYLHYGASKVHHFFMCYAVQLVLSIKLY